MLYQLHNTRASQIRFPAPIKLLNAILDANLSHPRRLRGPALETSMSKKLTEYVSIHVTFANPYRSRVTKHEIRSHIILEGLK